MADTQTAETTQQVADTTQQVTSQIPIASARQKNPKRVAAGKAIYEKGREAREAQAKKIAEADVIIANERLRKAQEEARKAEAVVDPPVEDPLAAPVAATATESNLTTTQWLSIASIIVSLAAIYYKREEIKGTIAKIKAPLAKAPAPMAPTIAKEPVLTAPKKKGIRSMD